MQYKQQNKFPDYLKGEKSFDYLKLTSQHRNANLLSDLKAEKQKLFELGCKMG